MTAVESALRAKRDAGHKVLVPYLMGGMTNDWIHVLQAVVAAGADAVEVGIPFSDPMMDGPVIQQADIAALARHTVPQQVLDDVVAAKVEVPIVVMTYYNIVFRAGHKRMAESMALAGVGGALIPDLPLEEMDPWANAAKTAGLETVLMVAPSTPPHRIGAICARAQGFVYAVARMGVTGERDEMGSSAQAVVEGVRAACDTPVLVGIGVTTPDQAARVCEVADGVIVGSALVRRLLEGEGPEGAANFIGELRSAIDAG
jgi:tryptophan synthase alpha chain